MLCVNSSWCVSEVCACVSECRHATPGRFHMFEGRNSLKFVTFNSPKNVCTLYFCLEPVAIPVHVCVGMRFTLGSIMLLLLCRRRHTPRLCRQKFWTKVTFIHILICVPIKLQTIGAMYEKVINKYNPILLFLKMRMIRILCLLYIKDILDIYRL